MGGTAPGGVGTRIAGTVAAGRWRCGCARGSEPCAAGPDWTRSRESLRGSCYGCRVMKAGRVVKRGAPARPETAGAMPIALARFTESERCEPADVDGFPGWCRHRRAFAA